MNLRSFQLTNFIFILVLSFRLDFMVVHHTVRKLQETGGVVLNYPERALAVATTPVAGFLR